MTEEPLYNSRVLQTFLELLEKRYRQVDIKKLLREAGIEPYQVSDEGHWFTQREVDTFYDRLVEVTGNAGIAREAGQLAGSAESMGFLVNYLLGLIGPVNAFNAVPRICGSLVKSSRYEGRRLSSSRVEITVTPHPGVQERPYQCDNRLGSFEAMLAAFNCGSPAIEHPQCMFRGDPVCRYVISWKETLYLRVRRVCTYLGIAPLAAGIVLAPFHPWQALTLCLPLGLVILTLGSNLAGMLERKELHRALASLKESTDQLLDQSEVNYRNALMVNEVGQAISKQAGIDEVLHNVVKALENRLSYDRCVILLADPEGHRLEFRIGFGYTEEELALLNETSFNLANPESQGVFVTCFKLRQPYLVDDFSEISSQHSQRSQLLAERFGAKSFLCCPIVCEGESLGILAVDNIRSKKTLLQSDLSLMMGIAPMIGISLRNAIYIERERQRSEQMRQSQKMEAVGQLAGGIAHDFNNLLTAIMGFATLAQMGVKEGTPPAAYLDEVLLASERATHLTKGLLSFSRKQAPDLQPVELNAGVERIEKLLRRLISEEINLVLRYSPTPLIVHADTGQLDQVLVNLATNARDAMDHCGTLTIETAEVQLGAGFLPDCCTPVPGRYARLSLSDTGKGMDAATKSRLFEPFFTTKEVGKGTGLGLSIVYGIVKQHNGLIRIESAPGQGTRFEIYLPLREGKAPGAAAAAPALPVLEGEGTLLVVEDAPEVRLLTCKVLESHGYRVIEAVDGEDAVAKFREHQESVRLVIMDVVMPRLNGKEAFEQISRIRPETRVLFTSGYTPDHVNAKGVRFGTDNFLAKPCTPEALLQRVAELMA